MRKGVVFWNELSEILLVRLINIACIKIRLKNLFSSTGGEIEESNVLPSIVKNKLRPLPHLQLQNPASECTFVLSANLASYDHKTLLCQSPLLMRLLLSNVSRIGQTCVLVSQNSAFQVHRLTLTAKICVFYSSP